MARRRTQRYSLECEFLLKDRSDYAAVREAVRKALHDVEQRFAMSIDYMAIAQKDEPK